MDKDLFKYVLEKEGIQAKQMAHIGDNYVSDYENPKKLGIQAQHLPKASDIFQDKNVTHNLSTMFTKSLPMWRDNKNSLNFLGIRCMMGIVANKYFDNPYKTFNYTADFNADPYLIGYYALGMYMLGLTKWMLDDIQGKGYKNMVFMARDGYLPIKCYDIMKKLYTNVPESRYLYISRKALVPITIQTKLDLYKLSEVINVTNHSPKDILKYIKDCITIKDERKFENICKEQKIKMDEDFKIIENFDKFISLVIEHLYDEEKQNKNLEKYREYFNEMYEERSATFDIGYSARPEMFLSNLLQKPIDTYFCNINHSEAQRHAQIGGFKLKTFFDAKPTTTGHAYEMMLSALAPSCIGYDVSGEEIYKNMVFMARDGYLPIKCYDIMKKLYTNVPESRYLYISRKALVPITIQTKLDLYKLSEVINVTNHSPKDILKYIKDCITIKDERKFENICKEQKIKMDEDFKIIENFDKFISLVIEHLYDEEKQNKNLEKYREYFNEMYEERSATFDIGYSARPEMFLSNLLQKPIDTYFCNINHSEAQRHAQIGGFKLKTFFDAKPTTTGHAYEMMLSALAPSCIGYDVSGEEIKPIFEKYENTYTVEFAMKTMQDAAEDFVRDVVDIFGQDIDIIYYQNYYISLPFMAYLNSSKEIDKMPFSSVIFEDNVGLGEPLKMVTNWTQDLSTRNQATMDNLFGIDNDISEFLGENELVYNSTVDLKDRNKLVRLIYYILFDKKTLSRRIGDVCYKHKALWAIYQKIKYKK